MHVSLCSVQNAIKLRLKKLKLAEPTEAVKTDQLDSEQHSNVPTKLIITTEICSSHKTDKPKEFMASGPLYYRIDYGN